MPTVLLKLHDLGAGSVRCDVPNRRYVFSLAWSVLGGRRKKEIVADPLRIEDSSAYFPEDLSLTGFSIDPVKFVSLKLRVHSVVHAVGVEEHAHRPPRFVTVADR